jgi:DNA-binding CsgD family transcriptional regulator
MAVDGGTSALTPKFPSLRWLACGYSRQTKSPRLLDISVRTETHQLNVRRKLGISGQAGLVRYADGDRSAPGQRYRAEIPD